MVDRRRFEPARSDGRLSKTDDDNAVAGILEDAAELARKLAEQEPLKSATGPDALLAFAEHLDGMIAKIAQPSVAAAGVSVPMRRKRSGR